MSYKTDIYKIQENGIDVFCFCEQSYLPKQSTEFKSYDGYLKIIRVLSGVAVWKIENKEYPVKKDDILIVNNTERRQIVMQNVNEPFVIEYAQFLPFFLHPHQRCTLPFFFRESNFNHLHAEKDEYHGELLTLFCDLSKAVKREYLFKKEYVYSLLLQAVALFGEKLRNKNTLSPVAEEKNLHLYQTICKISDYVSKNPEKDLSEEFLAKKFHISKHYLSRSFKLYNGVSYPTFVKTIRVHYATNLIKNGVSVTDAAFASGFGSLSAFYTAFKELTGYSPKQYLFHN
jgi:AraC-like DNA-binding protein